ncbi:carbohydrate ABC transporter permease [Vallitalea okinawensis]|uniref:carbohydrate ABC transporter permease n=1 Tax=Vallitalea okinawensis TaxID=2078660 RepID=UPI000CFAF8FE|nr:carbohydrate ABC transporter permease [Vallitalea okinawensis]
MKYIKKILSWLGIYSVMIFTVVVSIIPLIWVIISSLKSNKEILGSPFSLPTGLDLSAYINVIETTNLMLYFKNSMVVTLTSTIIALFIYALAAYVFAKFDFKGKNSLFILFSITLLIPGHARAQPIFALINNLNLYDTLSGLTLVYISGGLAVTLFILKATFMSIPRELDEAAIIDSASFWQVFTKINLPLAKSGLATGGILMFLGNWNEFYYGAMLLSAESKRTLPVSLQFFNEQFSYNYTELFAAITLATLPSVILYLCVQEQVQQSIASSGVKG